MADEEVITILKREFGLTNEDIKNRMFYISFLDKHKIETRTQFYMQEFKMTKEEFRKMIKSSPALFSYKEKTVKAKEEFYINEFKLTKDEFCRMLKMLPALLSYNEESVKAKEEFYINQFKMTKEEFCKMLKVSPALLNYNEESVKSKEEFYINEFNLTKEEFNKILKMLPALLSYNEETVKSKEKFYIEEFNLTKEEFGKMIKLLPTLLGLNEKSVKLKHKAMKELEIDESLLIKYPQFLNSPAESIKIKYMILYIANNSNSFIKNANWQMTSHKKTWARLSWLREMGVEKIKLTDIIGEEKRFFNKFKINSKILMKKFPFTKDAIEQINVEYKETAKRTGGLELQISDEELEIGE